MLTGYLAVNRPSECTICMYLLVIEALSTRLSAYYWTYYCEVPCFRLISPRDTCDDDSRRFSDTSRGLAWARAHLFRIRFYLRNARLFLHVFRKLCHFSFAPSRRSSTSSTPTSPTRTCRRPQRLGTQVVEGARAQVAQPFQDGQAVHGRAVLGRRRRARLLRRGQVGKMHGDLSKSAKDDTLEHSLFAAVRPHGQCEICGGCVR